MDESGPPHHPDTRAIRIRSEPSAHRGHAAAICLTSSFTFESAGQARGLLVLEKRLGRFTLEPRAEIAPDHLLELVDIIPEMLHEL